MQAVISRNLSGVCDAHGIDYPFLPSGISTDALIQLADTGFPVQHRIHFLHLVIPVRTPLLQRVNQPLFPAVRTDGHIVKGRQPAPPDKFRNTP